MLEYIMVGLLVVVIVLLLVLIARKSGGNKEELMAMERRQKEELDSLRTLMVQEMRSSRQESDQRLGQSLESFRKTITSQGETTDQRLFQMKESQEKGLESVRLTVEKKLSEIAVDNQKQLDEMRKTVDEKLQKTLEERMNNSFKLVSEQLEQVYKSMGEMQTLAAGVGDLKRVLTNVKTKGILGEIQLGRILEQILTPAQYVENVITKKGSRDPVEFAVKLPGKEDDSCVYLPIDAKFPSEAYVNLMDAYESGDPAATDSASKQFERVIKTFAKDISDKYIDPPGTTDFAIMFLPTEGLYAEVVKRPDLVETLARTYHINIAGPTTLSALLNALQMGFKTLAIEQRSHEVWNILGAVKTEFGTFATALEGAQKKITAAGDDIDKLVGVRTRQMLRKLRGVEEISEPEAKAALEDAVSDILEE